MQFTPLHKWVGLHRRDSRHIIITRYYIDRMEYIHSNRLQQEKEELSKNEAVLSDLILRVNNNTTADSAALEFNFAYLYAYLLTNNEPLGLGFWYINHTLNAILKYSEIAKYKECNALVEMLLSTITEPPKIKVNKKRKEDLLKLVLSIHGIGNIDKYSDVLSLVSNLGE